MEEESASADSSKLLGVFILASQRVNVLLLIAIWLWQSILKFLSSYQLDISTVIQTRNPNDIVAPLSQIQMQRLSRHFAVRISKIIIPLQLISLTCQPWVTSTEESNNIAHLITKMMPIIQFSIITSFIIRECEIIKYCIRRILLIEPTPRPMRNVYILLSDSLTSFTKPLIDFTLYLTSFFFSQDAIWGDLDLLISLFPLNIRIWQCLREFYLTRDKSLLANALKYFSSVPIMICVWHSRVEPDNHNTAIMYWFLALNSCFTLFWDIRMDWKLDSFRKIRKDHKTLANVMFPKIIYYIGCLIDFTIKFWWVWVSNRTNRTIWFQSELQYLEIFRRSVWVIFKLESEYVTTRNLVTEK